LGLRLNLDLGYLYLFVMVECLIISLLFAAPLFCCDAAVRAAQRKRNGLLDYGRMVF